MTQVLVPPPAATTGRPVGPAGPADLAGLTRVTRKLRLRPGVAVEIVDPGTFVLVSAGQRATPQKVSGWLLELLQRLATAELAEDELQAAALAGGGPLGLFRWVETLRRLTAAGLIEPAGYRDDVLLSRLVSVGSGPTLPVEVFDPEARQRVSTLAVVVAEPGQGWCAHRPESHLRVQLGPAALRVLAAAAEWTDWVAIQRASDLSGPEVRAVADHLTRAGVLVQWRSGEPAPVDPVGPGGWSPYDWWLHARSRTPRALFGWAGSYPGRGVVTPAPAVPARRSPTGIALPVPDLGALSAGGSDRLVAVMERRSSIREHDDDHPVTLAQLAELLYRTVRIRATYPGADGQDALDKPIPSGGALHELELYPVVQRCEGLDPGMYHYRADSHELEWVADPARCRPLVDGAQAAYTQGRPPQVVLLVSARFARVQYKYDAIPYALILKNTGVLLANLYLVATDMGLAGTAVGAGSLADFAVATGLDPAVESSVGEFVVGSSTPAARSAIRFAAWDDDEPGGDPHPAEG